METAKEFNVYNKISRGEHICRGDKLYSREEIKKMLNDSGLSAEEIKMLYELNAEAAFEEVSKMAEEFMKIALDEQIVLSREDGTTFKSFYDLVKTWFIQKIALWLQIVMGLFAAVVIYKKFPGSGMLVLPLFLLGISYLVATIFADILAKNIDNIARYKVWPAETYGNDTVKGVLAKRWGVMNSVCNTLHMYECMEDYIKNEEPVETPILEPEIVHMTDDDLK